MPYQCPDLVCPPYSTKQLPAKSFLVTDFGEAENNASRLIWRRSPIGHLSQEPEQKRGLWMIGFRAASWAGLR